MVLKSKDFICKQRIHSTDLFIIIEIHVIPLTRFTSDLKELLRSRLLCATNVDLEPFNFKTGWATRGEGAGVPKKERCLARGLCKWC